MAENDAARGADNSVMAKRVGLGLAVFSIGLGLVELAAPGRIARWLGVDNDTAKTTIRAFGAREIAAGAALLKAPASSTNVWNRVLGDAIDAGALGLAAAKSERTGRVMGAMAFVGGAMVADVLAARALDKDTGRMFPRSERPRGLEAAEA
jgi:hypothetical protein